ncbi:Uncharacterised protein [Mycobacterium tuberculosis]|jgi:hypothetical protein|nr:hypothetical protein C7M27_04311 [Bacillus subtilis]SGI72561.1 Uncharacterised protein [Mycobacterium tuberculosis]SLL37339.1 Uncharacterised protein [Mycobacteroides abscessus subsp. abscessus]
MVGNQGGSLIRTSLEGYWYEESKPRLDLTDNCYAIYPRNLKYLLNPYGSIRRP